MIEILTWLPSIVKMLTPSYPMRYGIVETVSMTGPRWNTLHKLNYVSLVQQLGVMADHWVRSIRPSKIPVWMSSNARLRNAETYSNLSKCGAEISPPWISIRQVKSFLEAIFGRTRYNNVLNINVTLVGCSGLSGAHGKNELSIAKIPITPHIQTWDRNNSKVRNAELWGTGDNAYMYSSLVQDIETV